MRDPFGSYNPELVHKFYSSYTILVDLIIYVGQRAWDQTPLDHNLVRGNLVDISDSLISIWDKT